MAASDPTAGDGAKPAKGGVMGLIVEILVATLIAAAAGTGIAFMTQAPAPTEGAAAPAKAGEGAQACAAGPNLVDLPTIVTNIAAPADLWVRVEASIVVDAKTTPHPEVLAAEIATDELAYLRTLSISQLDGPIGLENVRQDLTDRAVVRSKGKVNELILKTLVLQ